MMLLLYGEPAGGGTDASAILSWGDISGVGND
jgi:hypothetical protein